MEIKILAERIHSSDYHFLRTSVGWSSYNSSEIDEGLNNTLFTVVAYAENRVVGMGRIIGDGKLVFYIQDIIVLPEFQNKGIGKNIMKKILAYINERSVNNSIIGLMAAKEKEGFYESF